MSRHRTHPDELHHLREARRPSHVTDLHVDRTTAAYQAMVDGTYKGARSRDSGAEFAAENRIVAINEPRSDGDREPLTPTQVARVRADLERSRIVPTTTSVPCPRGHADAGALCFGQDGRGIRGVCAERVTAVAALRAPTSARVIGGGR